MTNGEVLDLMYDVFVLAVQLGGPVLVISMLVGVLISIIQAATQIHEQTITFVPKLLVIVYGREHAGDASGFYSTDLSDDTGMTIGARREKCCSILLHRSPCFH